MIIQSVTGPRKIQTKVLSKVKIAEDTYSLKFGMEGFWKFRPGQYVSLKVSEDGHRRSYSVASFQKGVCELVVDTSPGGMGSKYVERLVEGDEIEIMAFLGRFVVEEKVFSANKEIVFIATGSGIVPFKSMVIDALEKGYSGKIELVWGVRFVQDLFWMEEFEKIKNQYKNFECTVILSKPDDSWSGREGHVGDVIKEMLGEWSSKSVFLCGASSMITETREKLAMLGTPVESIYFEKFF